MDVKNDEMVTDYLNSLVANYGKIDAQIKELKKTNDADKELLKEHLAQLDNHKWTAGGFTVSRIESTSETLNEPKLLKLMQNNRVLAELNGILKIKEYVDMDALESAIYSGKLPQELLQEMNECKETKTTVAIRCSKAKE